MLCNCDTGLFNLQSADCIVKPSIIRKFVFVEYFKSDGTVNGIDLNSTFGETEIDALLAQTDAKLRWYLSDSISNFVTERADPNTETIDNVNYILSQGTRTMSGDFIASSADLAKKINSNNCVQMGVYLIDDNNGVNGVVTRDGFLDPIKLEKNAFGKIVFATEANIFKVSYSSTWGKNVLDGNVKTLQTEVDFDSKKGLIDVSGSVTSSAITEATAIYAISNGSTSGIPLTGLVAGDFAVYNTTTDAIVAVTTAVESPDGTYLLSFTAQTAADVLTVTATKSGFSIPILTVTV